MKILTFLINCFLLIFTIPVLGQQNGHIPGDLLVQLAPGLEADQWIERWSRLQGVDTRLVVKEQLSLNLNIWLLHFDPTQVDENRFLAEIRRKDPQALNAQWNHIVKQRNTEPNDPDFSKQWQYVNTGQDGGLAGADLDADLAWDITTGGQTALGDTIVVCVIDDGLDPSHQDFGENLWVNQREIPDNGVDDDQNGYVDDYRGWNARRNNDQIDDTNTHGTPVAGIIGARGDNNLGVSGLNWAVKIMVVVGGIRASRESDYIKAFEYPLQQRKLYNISAGKRGAFVVATNGSWGVDTARTEDFPLWSAFYDTLGVHGVLNLGAVSNNNNTNIDERGDMPASSPSPYLITVTNIDHRDQKVEGAGFGALTVDLAAYGGDPETGVWTTKNNNSYGRFPGTSAATPHVAGAVGLLYSAPCESFANLARTDPSGAASLVRQLLLDGAKPVPALHGSTLTGGKLNLFNSLQLLLQECTDCFPASTLLADEIAPNSARLTWNVNDSISRVDLRWRSLEQEEWQEITDVESPYVLDNLLACVEYEIQLNTFCQDTELGFGESLRFQTDGCCSPPVNFRTIVLLEDRFFIRWDPVTAALGYEARIRAQGSEVWDTLNAARDGSLASIGLDACTMYELQVRALCEGENSDFSPSFLLQTLGCGFCIDEADQYCQVNNINGTEEWIARVQFNTLDQSSGGGSGYRDYGDLEPGVLNKETEYEIIVVPGFSGQAFGRYTEVYIDYNQDGFFSGNEKVFVSERSTEAVSGAITIPATALSGLTRMRVSMLAKPNVGPCPGSTPQTGEVEDYCVTINPATPTKELNERALKVNLFPNPFRDVVTLRMELPTAEPSVQIAIIDAFGRKIRQWQRTNLSQRKYEEQMALSGLPSGVYWVVVKGERFGRKTARLIKGE